jgi:hypothetical protein
MKVMDATNRVRQAEESVQVAAELRLVTAAANNAAALRTLKAFEGKSGQDTPLNKSFYRMLKRPAAVKTPPALLARLTAAVRQPHSGKPSQNPVD